VGDGRGGGGLGSQRGDDCGSDLCLKGRGGFGIRHPKNNKNGGLELEEAVMTADCGWGGTLQQHRERNTKQTCRIYVKCYENEERNCGWSGTRQQHSKHETKRTVS
jgi:hypothetical protein